ncbi:MAG: murein biosynthesis integral membrane protein MurJ [Chlamydiae bacterium]|nr:murein biosynthesis integral membrane protein MurJ [Chlamydiota bacterium]
MSIDTEATIAKSANKFLFGTFLSRFSGMFRDMAIAAFFGSSPSIALFMVAFRFANFFRRFLGEGTIQSGFVPHYEALRKESPLKASGFYRDLIFSLAMIILAVIVLSTLGLMGAMHFASKEFKEIFYLTIIMLPSLLFICLYALNSSFLQCHKSYFLPAAAPIAFNLVWIIAALLLRNEPGYKAAIGMSIGVIIAFFFQWLMTAPKSYQYVKVHLNKADLKPKLFSEEIKKLIKPISLTMIGVGAVQLNTLLDSFFAVFADPQAPAYLWYAIRLEQLPISFFGVALSGALLPPLSRSFQANDLGLYKTFLNNAICKVVALMLTCTIAIFVLGGSSVNLIFARGNFDQATVVETIICLWGYAIGLLPTVLTFILAAGFYAKKRYFEPTIASAMSVVLNILLNSLFVFAFDMKALSIAVATSLSAFLNALILFYYLQKEQKDLFDKKIIITFFKTLICVGFSGVIVFLVGMHLNDASIQMIVNLRDIDLLFPRSFTQQFMSFSILASVFFATLFLIAYIIKAKEILDLIKRK